jgi:hypothetical protein
MESPGDKPQDNGSTEDMRDGRRRVVVARPKIAERSRTGWRTSWLVGPSSSCPSRGLGSASGGTPPLAWMIRRVGCVGE